MRQVEVGYAADPTMEISVSVEERGALVRISEIVLDRDTSGWLEGLEPNVEYHGYYKTRFGELVDHLIGIVFDWGLGENISAGDVSEDDAVMFASLLSHVLQRHVKVEEIIDGSVKRHIDCISCNGRYDWERL